MSKISVIINGAYGRMGRETVKTILLCGNMELAGAIDVAGIGKDAGIAAGCCRSGVIISDDIDIILKEKKPQVMVDFSRGDSAPKAVMKALSAGCACIVGTTGISSEDLAAVKEKSESTGTPVLIVPNFSIGAVLMMKFARDASSYFDWAEIIELHHEKKADAPSGTALRTADMMAEKREVFNSPQEESEKVEGARGGIYKGIRIHSVRLPGLLAHQEVSFGGMGEVLRIRHDSISRECFMPGVILGIERVLQLKGMITGLENVL